ncbi:hypothetical protein E3N88_32037 [Mikania micrantha]|uniref:Uncharacterized protein n=1 Tax=Mikania micrantha TaxID=192012 RepID=A0A5N6MA05_9ASTR|nr:hypothetical protein E3N88_32037 [Mikania micrantha]
MTKRSINTAITCRKIPRHPGGFAIYTTRLCQHFLEASALSIKKEGEYQKSGDEEERELKGRTWKTNNQNHKKKRYVSIKRVIRLKVMDRFMILKEGLYECVYRVFIRKFMIKNERENIRCRIRVAYRSA